MSNPVSDEPIACASCEFRYPRSRAICPMCGTAASAVEPIQPPSPVPDEFRTNHKTLQSSLNSQPRPPHPGLRRLIPVVVVSIVFMVVSSVLYEVHKRNLAKESGSAAELTATSGQPEVKNADQRHMICAWSVSRSNMALHNLAFGNMAVHSENGRFVVTITAALSARPAMIWNNSSAAASGIATYAISSITINS